MKVEKLAKNGEKGQNCYPLSPEPRSSATCSLVMVRPGVSFDLWREKEKRNRCSRGYLQGITNAVSIYLACCAVCTVDFIPFDSDSTAFTSCILQNIVFVLLLSFLSACASACLDPKT